MAISTQPAPAPAPLPASSPPTATEDRLWPLTVHQYHEMIRHGIIEEDDPVELLDGLLITTMGKSPAHRHSTRKIRQALERVISTGHSVEAQDPVTLETSEPEPDVSVVRGDSDQFSNRHPGSADLVLVVEVADSSLCRDRGLKKRLYAEAGIPVYWIVNLIDRQIEGYTLPTGPAELPDYAEQQTYRAGDSVPLAVHGTVVAQLGMVDLLP